MSTESNKQNVPKIRFPGFKEPWEQRKFGSLMKERREKTVTENEDQLISCAINGLYLNSELFSHFRGSSNIGYLKIRKNDLILSAQNLHLGNVNVNKRFTHGIISPAYKVFSLLHVDPDFIQAWVKREETKHFFLSATTEGASLCRKNIDWNQLMNQQIFVPACEEQQQIGTFFQSLDNLITLHQRELDDLKKLKKGLLQKMFPKPGKQIPEIRFPEFTEPWEQRKLSELTNRLIQKNKNLESELPLTISAQFGLVDQETFFNKRVASKDLRNYLLVNNGEFAYNKSYSAGYPWGTVKRLDRYPKGVVSSLYVVFSPIPEEIDSCFLVTFFESDLWYPEIAKRAAEGARNHGLLNIPSSDFFDMKITIPSLSEQQQIGKFFASFDNLITLHQQQLDNLKVLKSGLLQQMFV